MKNLSFEVWTVLSSLCGLVAFTFILAGVAGWLPGYLIGLTLGGVFIWSCIVLTHMLEVELEKIEKKN